MMFLFSLIISSVCLLDISSAAPTLKLNHDARVINGQDAVLGQFPWHVGVAVIYENLNYHFCSGALISEQWVLTAAHCFVGSFDVSGVHAATIDNYNSDGLLILTNRTIVHEDFDNSTLQNDIALIQLDTSITFNENVSAIALSDENLEADVLATIAGWGHSDHDDTNNMTYSLQYGYISTIDNTECQEIYGSDVVQPSVVCTIDGPSGESPCYGDGGAPLVLNADSDPVLVAILSFFSSLGCGGEYPTGFTRVASYREWIREKSGV